MNWKSAFALLMLYSTFHGAFSQGAWTQKVPFGGTVRSNAVGFSIGTKGYIGTGIDAGGSTDFWEWDQSANTWTQKANYGGGNITRAVGFSIGTKGYIGTGRYSSGFTNDFWEWDQGNNTWTEKTDFGGPVRWDAVGFSIGTKGYIGTGANGNIYYNDFWEYDPADISNGFDLNGNPMGAWIQKANFGGVARLAAVGFSINTKGYIGTGTLVQFNTDMGDFWEYDPTSMSNGTDVNGNPMGEWVQKADFAGVARQEAVAFSIGTKGYIGTGYSSGTLWTDFWEYDPADMSNGTDSNGNPKGAWTAKANCGSSSRCQAVGFSIGCNGYIGTGWDAGSNYYKDFWEWNPVIFSVSTQNILCNNQCNGSAVANPISGIAPFTYQWNNGQTTQTTTGFCAGTCICIITDSTGCSSSDTVTITEPDTLATSISSQINVSCNAGTNGSASVSASGGISPYTYLWNTSPSQSTSIASNLPAGNYIITVADSNGCINTDTVTIIQPDSIAITIISANVTCNGNNDGSLTANVTGGTTPYAYSWSSGGTGATESNLSVATYTVTVTDSNNCSAVQTGIIEEPAVLVVSIASISNVSCTGGNNGSATAGVTGGTMPYTYLWSSGGTGAVENNLSVGAYTITVTDSNNCTGTQTVSITEPGALVIDSMVTNVSCNGGSNGSAMAMVLGGTAPYSYFWSSGGTAATENSLSSGTYTLTVTDSNSCIASDTVLVSEPLLLTVDVLSSVDVTCSGGNNGSATAGANGGVVPYIYSWSSGSTVALANNLSAESYTVTVTDSNSCVSIDSITIQEPLPLGITLSSSPTVCSGSTGTATAVVTGGVSPYIYLWSSGGSIANEDSLSAGTYTIIVSDSGSCIKTDSITIISVDSVLSIAFTTVPTVCTSATGVLTAVVGGGVVPYTYFWSSGGEAPTEDSLSVGTYTITITDVNGCTQNGQGTITSTNPLTLSVSSTPTACDTSTGTATVVPANGTQPYLYSWSTTPLQDSATALGLSTGNYTVTVTDSNGCMQTQTETITLSSGPVALVATSLTTIQQGSSTPLLAVGGDTYSWSPVEGLSCINCPNPVAAPSETTTYCVIVSDSSNCTDSACVTIIVETPCGKLEVPTAFSPNNDGHNDFFVLQGLGNCVESFSFMIFDRWGEKVFTTDDIQASWDGTHKDKPLNPAVFVYYIDATFINGERINKKGNISLIR